jgi:hypothetical protein
MEAFMDIGKSFSYPFEDNKWLSKLIIGALVSIVPILNFAWAGYLVDLVKNVMNRAAEPLPEWTEFGDKFMKGLLIWVAGLIYALPAICVGTIFFTTLGITLGSVTEGDYVNTLGSIFSGVGILLTCLIVLYGLALSFFYPAMIIHFSRKENFGSLFEIGAIIKVATSKLSPYLTAWLIGIVAAIVVSIVVGLVGVVLNIIPCVGWLIAYVLGGLSGVYITAIWAHLFGQAAAEVSSTAMVS